MIFVLGVIAIVAILAVAFVVQRRVFTSIQKPEAALKVRMATRISTTAIALWVTRDVTGTAGIVLAILFVVTVVAVSLLPYNMQLKRISKMQ